MRTGWTLLLVSITALALWPRATVAAPYAYIANTFYDQVKVVDTATMSIVGQPIAVGPRPVAVAVSPDARAAYVLNQGDHSLSVIDTQKNAVIGGSISLSFGIADIVVSPDSSTIYVSVVDSIAVISAATRKVQDVPVCAGGEPNGLAISPDGSRLYVGCAIGTAGATTGVIYTMDTATLQVVGPGVHAGKIPDGMAVTPDQQHIYVADQLTNTVAAISAFSNAVEAIIPVDLGPQGLAMSPDGNYVYVTCSTTDTVSVISVASNTVIHPSIHVGKLPVGIAFTPDGKKVFTVNYGDTSLSVIDVATGVVTPLPGFNGPHTLGKFIAAASTSMSLEGNPNPSRYGHPIILTATVAGGTPSGSVSFSDQNSGPIGIAAIDSSMSSQPTAVLANTFLDVGTHTLTASFPGSAYSLAATASMTQIVSKALTITTITSVTPDASGSSAVVVALTTDSLGNPPTGNITISDSSSNTCTFTLPASGCTLRLPTKGRLVLAAVYGGDQNYEGSSGTKLLLVGAPSSQAPALSTFALALLIALVSLIATYKLNAIRYTNR